MNSQVWRLLLLLLLSQMQLHLLQLLVFLCLFSVFLKGFPNFHDLTRIAFIQFEEYAVLSSPRSLQNSAHTRNGFGAQ